MMYLYVPHVQNPLMALVLFGVYVVRGTCGQASELSYGKPPTLESATAVLVGNLSPCNNYAECIGSA